MALVAQDQNKTPLGTSPAKADEIILPPKPNSQTKETAEEHKELSPALKKAQTDLNTLAKHIETQLTAPLEKMVRESKGPLSPLQLQTIEDFNKEGMRVFTEQAGAILKGKVDLPADYNQRTPEDKMIVLSTTLAKENLYLHLMPKEVSVTFENDALKSREQTFSRLLKNNGYPEKEAQEQAKDYAKKENFTVFAPKLLGLGKAEVGAAAFNLQNNATLELPDVEGQKVNLPTNVGIKVQDITDTGGNSLSIRGTTISFKPKDGKEDLKVVILNRDAIKDSADKLGVSPELFYNHTKSNELGALSLESHLDKQVTKGLLDKLILVDIPISSQTQQDKKEILQLAIGYEHLAELYSDMTSLQTTKYLTSPILNHHSGPEEYSLIKTAIASSLLNAMKDGLINLPAKEISPDSLEKVFSKDRELEKKFANEYLGPEMRKVFDTALKQAKDVLKEEGIIKD